MAINSIVKFTIASGASDLNEDINAIGTPTWELFNQPENKLIEPGDVASDSVLFEDEAFSFGDPDSRDTGEDDFLDPFEHMELNWAYSVSYFNLGIREIEKNLGRFSIRDLVNRNDVIRKLPSGNRNTIRNMLEPRIRNMKHTLSEKSGEHLFNHVESNGRKSPSGIDIITEPDTEYAGLDYKALGQADIYSALMGGFPDLWNPLHKHVSNRDISFDDYVAAADDLSSLDRDMKTTWTVFAQSRARYHQTIDFLGIDNANDSYVCNGRKMVFLTDPNIHDDDIVYFWKLGAIKKRMQSEMPLANIIDCVVSHNQKIVKFVAELEHQYLCTQRVLTGRITRSHITPTATILPDPDPQPDPDPDPQPDPNRFALWSNPVWTDKNDEPLWEHKE